MSEFRKKISVCITTFNGELYILEQLKSILIQLNENDEIILSDDSSIDETINLVKSLNDNRIKIFFNNFRHHTPNFEFSLTKATGDFIFLSDQDDVWLPNKINIMLSYLKNYNLVVSDCFVVNEKLEIISNTIRFSNNPNGFFNNLRHNNFLGCCMAFDKKILKNALPFPRGILSHESWLGAVAGAFGTTKFIKDKLILYRRHNYNNSNTLNGSNLSFFNKLKYRFFILLNIFLRKTKIQ
jgi:glycosyltransferase involved in cell wall biosynthesis